MLLRTPLAFASAAFVMLVPGGNQCALGVAAGDTAISESPVTVAVSKRDSATKSGQVGGEVPHYRQGPWANTSLPAMPTARCGLAAVAINNTLYAVGGIYGNGDDGDDNYVSTLEAFDPATRTWDSSLPDMPSKRAYVAAVAINNVLYAVGGEDANGNYLDTLEAFDPATRKWDRSLPSMPTRRTSFAAVAINDVLYAVGGSAGDGIFLDTLEAFDPATEKWESLPSMSTNRVGLAAVAINNVLYAVGGEDGNGNYLDTLEAFDPATRKWDRPRNDWGRSKRRSYLAAVAINNVLYAVGGDNTNDGFLGTLEAFAPATRQWDRSLPSMSTARTGLAAVAINNVLYAVGGWNAGNASGTLEAFDPATRKWGRSLPSMSKV